MTEITKKKTSWLLIDAHCALCRSEAKRWSRALHALGFRVAPLDLAAERGLDPGTQEAVCVIPRHDRRRLHGADAVIHLCLRYPPTWPLGCLLALPGIHALARRAYHAVSVRRHRIGCLACERLA